jgi:hypothetical protein
MKPVSLKIWMKNSEELAKELVGIKIDKEIGFTDFVSSEPNPGFAYLIDNVPRSALPSKLASRFVKDGLNVESLNIDRVRKSGVYAYISMVPVLTRSKPRSELARTVSFPSAKDAYVKNLFEILELGIGRSIVTTLDMYLRILKIRGLINDRGYKLVLVKLDVERAKGELVQMGFPEKIAEKLATLYIFIPEVFPDIRNRENFEKTLIRILDLDPLDIMDLCDAVEAVFGDDYRHVNKMLMISLRMIDDVQRKRRKHIKSEELKTTVFG